MARTKKSSSKTTFHHTLVISVGSGSVEASIVILGGKNKPTIVATAHTEMSIEKSENDTYVPQMLKVLDKTLVELSKKATVVPVHTYVSLGAPWCTGQTRTIYHSKKEPFRTSEKLFDELVDTDKEKYLEDLSFQFDNEKLNSLDTTILETKVNGYRVDKPFGIEGRELEMTYYTSSAPTTILGNIAHTIEHHYRAKVSFFSNALASYAVTRSISPVNSYLYLDISEELTELSFIEDGILRGSVRFPMGKFFLLRTLSNEFKQSPLEIISLLTLCRDGRAHKKVVSGVERMLEVVEHKWKSGLAESVESLTESFVLPSTMLVSVSGDIAPWFIKMIDSEEYWRTGKIIKAPKVIELNEKNFTSYMHFDDLEHLNPQPALSTIYITSLGV